MIIIISFDSQMSCSVAIIFVDILMVKTSEATKQIKTPFSAEAQGSGQ